MRPKVNSNWFEISNHFEKLFHLHGDFTVFIKKCYQGQLLINASLINVKQMLR